MPVLSPLWPAYLHHFRLDTPDPERLLSFYREALGMVERTIGDGLWWLEGPARRMMIGKGAAETVPMVAYAIEDPARLSALRARLEENGQEIEPCPTPMLNGGAFAVRNPDGIVMAFGTPEADRSAGEGLPGRLQHIVFATTDTGPQRRFYEDMLGFIESDRVLDEAGEITAVFHRSDEEHHSYAAFRADAARFDHFALETGEWNDVRDWADRFAAMHVPLWWGPGRHGPGNNLFFMVRDPDGNRVEISAELELMPADMAYRTWPHEERTLNLWGQGWMRS